MSGKESVARGTSREQTAELAREMKENKDGTTLLPPHICLQIHIHAFYSSAQCSYSTDVQLVTTKFIASLVESTNLQDVTNET